MRFMGFVPPANRIKYMDEVRNQLVHLLTVRQAHIDFEDVVADFPHKAINVRPPHSDYSVWHLVEHIRICQRDILDYIVSDNYHWPNFPDDLWPDKGLDTDAAGWQSSIDQFLQDRQALVEIILDPANDLLAPLPNSGDHQHSILREIHIIASHNAYHTGELGILRQSLGLWGNAVRKL